MTTLLLESGCASAPPPPPPLRPPPPPSDGAALRIGDADAEVSVKRLSREQVLTVLGWRGQRLSESATILEVTVISAASPAQLSGSSFRLRLPTGEAVDPLEPKWVLAAMSLPGDAARSGRGDPSGRGESGWQVVDEPDSVGQVVDEPDSVGTALFDIALVSVFLVVVGIKAMIESSKARNRLRARADVWDMVALPRTVERGARDRLLVVYWPRDTRIPQGVALLLEVQVELARCTWRAEVLIPAE